MSPFPSCAPVDHTLMVVAFIGSISYTFPAVFCLFVCAFDLSVFFFLFFFLFFIDRQLNSKLSFGDIKDLQESNLLDLSRGCSFHCLV